MIKKRQMDKLRFLTESRNGKESVIEKLIHKDNFSSNRISCNIAEKSDIKSVMDICFARQQWMTEQGFDYVLCKDNRKYYRYAIEDRKLWVCKQSGVVMGFCVVDDHDINGYWKDFPTDSFVYAHDGMTRPPKSVKETSKYNFMGILLNDIMEFFGKGLRFDVLLPNQKLESYYEKELGFNPVGKVVDEEDGSWHLLMEKSNNNLSLSESFTKKIKSVRKSDLNSEASFVLDNGVYILHETLGVKTVKGWNNKDNEGVVGILVVEGEHKIVVATEDSPENLHWSKKRGLINQPIEELKDSDSDFNGEIYCRRLDSPDFPAAYYCKTYNKGNRDWFLPSSGELCMIYQHIEEVQSALSIVGGQKFVTTWDDENDVPLYWSSTEQTATCAQNLYFDDGILFNGTKVDSDAKVRPVSKFDFSTLKESFTRKIRSKKNDELTAKADTAFVPDGVYILHETLGVKSVKGWNPKYNEGVVGILLIEDEHQLVVALEDSPEKLQWSKFEYKLVNRPIEDRKDAESDFNGEKYCKNLNSPEFPAAYYCSNYEKGGRDWYLPSSGELCMIYQHIEEVQSALSIVGGQVFVTDRDVADVEGFFYWSSTEYNAEHAWDLDVNNGYLSRWVNKVSCNNRVRPVSNFRKNPLKESFTKKISSKKNTDLVSKPSFVLDDGVYILHETLGIKSVEEWNKKFNNGVVGILLIEDDHKFVVALEDSPENLRWKSKRRKLINQPVKSMEDAKSDFNGEEYCKNLDSPDFPAAYYCLNYKKGNRSWYLPSSGELWLIYRHLEEIQTALSIVEGQKFVTTWDEDVPCYWSSTERSATNAWYLSLRSGNLCDGVNKVSFKTRPISKFQSFELKESFTKKISSKKNTDLVSKPSFVLDDGVYILHETLGIKTVEDWNPKFNNGVVGILLIEDGHKIVVALEDAPEDLPWSNEYESINQPVYELEDAKSDFNGEIYCRRLNSPDFPAAYYCKTYNKGGRSWYLPSTGELWLICRHLEEIQNALETVGGQKLITRWDEGVPVYRSSTENSDTYAWRLYLTDRYLGWSYKGINSGKIRPVSNFRKKNTLRESFTKKISSKKNTDLVSEPSFVPGDGVYILHETLGVKTVDEWNPKDNEGVEGLLIIEDGISLIIALDETTALWAKKESSDYVVNRTYKFSNNLDSDSEKLSGKQLCQKLDSPKFPAAYFCLNYQKGNIKNWYLPSIFELQFISEHDISELNRILKMVGGTPFSMEELPCSYDTQMKNWYWASSESHSNEAWSYSFKLGRRNGWARKDDNNFSVRPVAQYDRTLKESFTKKISSKKNTDLISKPSFVLDNGVYILHETLGVRGVEGWNPKDNDGVVGILVVEDEHQLVVALEDSPKNLIWSKERKLVNRPIKDSEDAESDFNGEEYCRNLNSPDFPAAYYCLNYKKGGLDWYLPSAGELWLIYQHIEEVQNALSIVGGQRFDTGCDKCNKTPCYWSSTEYSAIFYAWGLYLHFGGIDWDYKASDSLKVRPISKFQPSELKESFTKKISSKKNTDLISKPFFVPDDGVYIFHKTLGLKTIDEWNRKDNLGVVGILVVQDEHQIVISLTDFLQTFHWSKEKGLVNKPIYDKSNAWSDFNGEEYCKKLNSKDFPAAYFCINYGNYRGVWSFDSLSAEEMAIKADYNWYLPSAGEMGIIYKNLNDVQLALRMVGGYSIREEFYLSSSEVDASNIWKFNMYLGELSPRCVKTIDFGWVRPVFKFNSNFLKESFTKKIKKTSNKDLVDTADKLAITNYDYNEENFKNKLRSETERYYKSEFYKVYHCPLDYRYNGDIWSADENGFHEMWLTSTKWVERDEGVDFEGYFNDVNYNCAEPADVGIFVFGYGKDCVAYGEYKEYKEYKKTRQLTESFVSKTKKKTIKDLQGKSDDVFNLNNLLREYVKSHCRPGSHNYDFYFSEENRPVSSDKEWKKLQGITVVKEIDDYYVPLHVVTPHGSTISNDFLPNVDDVFLFYIYRRRKFHIPVNRLPEKLLQELMEWILNINESFTRKTKQKSTEDIRQKADEHIGFENLVKEIVLENDSFKENDILSKTFRNRQPRYTHALNKLRVRPTSDPTLSPYAIQGMVVLDESFYFKPEKYNISSLLAKNLTRKSMKELYNSDSIIVLNRIYTMEYLEKELLRTEFNILRYNERYGRYSDEMNPQYVYFEFADLPKELQSNIYSFLHKKFIKN